MKEFLYNGELFDIYGALLNESNKKFYKLLLSRGINHLRAKPLSKISNKKDGTAL